jgi:hypothetical protein
VEFDTLSADIGSLASLQYILIYGILSQKEQAYICFVATEMNYSIVSIGYFNSCADINLVAVSVESWLGYIKSSRLVVTTFYHGVIFAFKFDRELYVFSRKNKDNKISSLVNVLDINCVKPSDIPEIFSGIEIVRFTRGLDYPQTLERALSESKRFLCTALAK